MKKIIIALAVMIALSLSATAVLAGGDKVHGDNGLGGVYQYCIEPGDCPWEN